MKTILITMKINLDRNERFRDTHKGFTISEMYKLTMSSVFVLHFNLKWCQMVLLEYRLNFLPSKVPFHDNSSLSLSVSPGHIVLSHGELNEEH